MRHVSRRTMLVGAGVGLGALADGARRPLLAQADRASAGPMWSAEYTAKKGDVSLALYRKRIGVPKAGERPRPVFTANDVKAPVASRCRAPASTR